MALVAVVQEDLNSFRVRENTGGYDVSTEVLIGHGADSDVREVGLQLFTDHTAIVTLYCEQESLIV